LTKTFTGISAIVVRAEQYQGRDPRIRRRSRAPPLDQASAQFNLARAYLAAGQKDMAEEHLLASLEAAPSFRPLRNCCCN